MRRAWGGFCAGFALVLGLLGGFGAAGVLAGCAKHYEGVAVGAFSQKSFSIKKGQVYLLFVSGENFRGVNLTQNSATKSENSANLKQNSHENSAKFEFGENSQKNSQKTSENAQNSVVHFVLTDALGVPKLKKDFINGKFKSVAFLPPNAEFDELFVQILRQIAAQKGGKIEFEFNGYEVKEL